jgi:hypothetical protein
MCRKRLNCCSLCFDEEKPPENDEDIDEDDDDLFKEAAPAPLHPVKSN